MEEREGTYPGPVRCKLPGPEGGGAGPTVGGGGLPARLAGGRGRHAHPGCPAGRAGEPGVSHLQ